MEEKPFYSPSVAKYCDHEARECGFMSWGQHAHDSGMVAGFTSHTLYATRATPEGKLGGIGI